ncbi:UNVERIFIED_CONTAM: hypothetical protein FKN15_010027 [Acipenser sinensis]
MESWVPEVPGAAGGSEEVQEDRFRLSVLGEGVRLGGGTSEADPALSYLRLLWDPNQAGADPAAGNPSRAEPNRLGKIGVSRVKRHARAHRAAGPIGKEAYDFSPSHPSKKKKLKPPPPLSPPSLRDTDTAMGLLKAITSPLATGSKPASTGGGAGGEGGRSHSHKPAYPPSHKHSHHHSSKHGSKGPPKLSQRPPKKPSKQGEVPMKTGAEGLKVKLILSPKEKGEGERGAGLGYPSPHSGGNPKKSLKKLSRDGGAAGGGGGGGGGGVATVLVSKTMKKKHTKEPLPAVGEEIEVEGASLLSPGHAHSPGTPNHGAAGGGVYPGATPASGSGGGVYLMAPPTAFSHHAGESQSEAKKKKKVKEEKDEKEKVGG